MTGLRRRLLRGFAANGFGQIVTLVAQLASVPLFLHYWGRELYGEWLLLSTIPTYLSISDLSFATAAQNEMTMRVARGDRQGALGIFQGAWIWVTLVSCGFLALALTFLWLAPWAGWLRISALTLGQARVVTSLLVLQVIWSQQGGLLSAGYRCDGFYARGTVAGNLLRLIEFLLTAVVVVGGGTLASVALIVLAARIVGYGFMWVDLTRHVRWLCLALHRGSAKLAAPLLLPALSYNAYPLGYALGLQGVLTVAGVLFGPSAAVLFSTTRTLTRIVWQLSTSIANTVWVELSNAFGTGDMALARHLHRISGRLALGLSVIGVLFLVTLGPAALTIWTRGRLSPDLTLLTVLALSSMPAALWSSSSIVRLANNSHSSMSVAFLLDNALTILVSAVLGRVWGLSGVAVGVLLGDVAMAVYVLPRSLRTLGDALPRYAVGLLSAKLQRASTTPGEVSDERGGEARQDRSEPRRPPAPVSSARASRPEWGIPDDRDRTRGAGTAASIGVWEGQKTREGALRVVLAAVGKYHVFDVARQLYERGMLEAIYTGYPWFKLRDEALPRRLVRTFPWFQTLYMGRLRLGLDGEGASRRLAWAAHRSLGWYAAATLPPCDVFVGLSGTGLRAGERCKARGGTYVCDRGSSHIRFQDRILCEEHALQGVPFAGIDRRSIEREEAEYAAADLITVPSTFAMDTFVEMGVSREKLRLVPYGVDLSRFSPVAGPDPSRFDVLFVGSVSYRKGIPYLLEAFAGVAHPAKSLTVVGSINREAEPMIPKWSKAQEVTFIGPVPQACLKEHMSRSHVMVLPSVEEGMALVQAQAMACGCPVIGTTNSGAADLYTDGVEGFIVPIRDPPAIRDRLQTLADRPDFRRSMSDACLARIRALGGWDSYGNRVSAILQELASPRCQ